MKKTIVLFSIFLLSCNTSLPTNDNNIDSKNDKITVSKQKNKFSDAYLKTMMNLKKEFLNNTEGRIRSSYIDNDNNTVIIFENIMYQINPNGDVKTYDLKDKSYNNYNANLYLDKGNGFGFFNPEIGDSFTSTYVVDFKSFEPQDKVTYSYIQSSLLFIDNKKNGIGYTLTNENKTINLYKVDEQLKFLSSYKNFTLNGNEKFYQNNFLNSKGKGFIFSEEYINMRKKSRMYLFENGQMDVNKPIEINFKYIDQPYYYVSGQIDDNGNGFLCAQNSYSVDTPIFKHPLEMRTIFNYKLQEDSYLFEDIKNPNIFINENGNGLITSGVDNKTMYIHTINNYNISKTDKISDDIFSSARRNINDKGNGFILMTYYKNSNFSNQPLKHYGDIILVENYKILENFSK